MLDGGKSQEREKVPKRKEGESSETEKRHLPSRHGTKGEDERRERKEYRENGYLRERELTQTNYSHYDLDDALLSLLQDFRATGRWMCSEQLKEPNGPKKVRKSSSSSRKNFKEVAKTLNRPWARRKDLEGNETLSHREN